MATKLEYLRLCVKEATTLGQFTWYINTLGVLVNFTQDTTNLKHLDLYLKPDGMYYIDASGEGRVEVRVDDYVKGSPMFLPRERVSIDSTWLESVSKPLETTIGRLLTNAVAINHIFKDRVPYINEQFSMSKLEGILTPRIKRNEDIKDPRADISIKEYLDCIDRLWFFTKLSKLVTVASSAKIITKPPGIDKLRAKLLKDNEGKMEDPVVVADIAEQLNNYDKEYLKDDMPSKLILSGNKKGNTSRKKMYQFFGEANDFDSGRKGANLPITSAMVDGVDTDDDVLPKYMNDMRFAAYSKGHSTQLSGYSYKILQRSLSGLEVSDIDCKVTVGLLRTPKKPTSLVNRYVKPVGGKQWELVSTVEEAGKYMGKALVVRSPTRCLSTGNTICYLCLGENFKGQKNAVNNMAASFSGELMVLFLKRMHTSGFTLTDIQEKDLFT